jgi:hypothetical protein
MPARRTILHGSDGWSAVALHLEAAGADQEGFYLTLYPDGKSQSVVFLRPHQLAQLLDLAPNPATTDQALWDVVAKIPLEPLLPNRALAARLRALLIECAAPIREQLRVQAERRPPPAPAPAELDSAGAEPPAEPSDS